MLKLYCQNDNLVTWDKMKSSASNAYVNDATVTMTLKDSAGDPMLGATDVALVYVTDSDGKYQGVIDSTVALVADTSYSLELTAESGVKNGFIVLECVAELRTS